MSKKHPQVLPKSAKKGYSTFVMSHDVLRSSESGFSTSIQSSMKHFLVCLNPADQLFDSSLSSVTYFVQSDNFLMRLSCGLSWEQRLIPVANILKSKQSLKFASPVSDSRCLWRNIKVQLAASLHSSSLNRLKTFNVQSALTNVLVQDLDLLRSSNWSDISNISSSASAEYSPSELNFMEDFAIFLDPN